MERETGVESKPCPTCGRNRNAMHQEDGSTAYSTCTKCYPKTEKAAENSPLADVNTEEPIVRITGTEVDPEAKA